MSLEEFRKQVRDLRRPTGMSQEALARHLGLHPTALSHKLNGTGDARLTHPEIKAIVLALVEQGGLNTQAEAEELLACAGLKPSAFSLAEWNTAPLSALEAPARPLTASGATTHNLPTPTTPLLGREREVQTVSDLLRRDDVRLVTLTGPGGTGKTRLGLAVSKHLIPSMKDGVFFVPLAPLRDPALVVSAVAQALGVREAGGKSLDRTLKDWLHGREMLLLMDNFEQVAEASTLVGELLQAAPMLKVLVTSRATLRIYGEYEFVVPPLAMPDLRHVPEAEALLQYSAISLFAERARAAKSTFAISAQNGPAVAEICARLDGLPLAIELAAARSKLFSPDAMLARLSNRLALLTGGARNLDPRHQTLRNTIEWSYNLLDPKERALFVRLGVFAGGCTLEAIEALTDDSKIEDSPEAGSTEEMLDLVSSLADKSMLRQEQQPSGEPRFWMLQTIREYALAQLMESGEEAAIRGRHASYYARVAEVANSRIRGPEQATVMLQLEQELDNMRAALDHVCDTRESELALRMAGALWFFWLASGRLSEGSSRLSAALALAGTNEISSPAPATLPDPALLASVMNAAGLMSGQQGDFVQAVYWTERSLDMRRQLGDRQGVANALNNLGEMARHTGEDYGKAERLLEESLCIQRDLGNKRGIASVLGNLASLAHDLGDYKRAAGMIRETVELMRELGHMGGLANALDVMGDIERLRGNLDHAQILLEEGRALCRELGDNASLAVTSGHMGQVALAQGNLDLAAGLLRKSLTMHAELGDRRNIAGNLQAFGELELALGHEERSAGLYGAVEAVRLNIGVKLPPSDEVLLRRDLDQLRVKLGDSTLQLFFAQGQNMSLEQAVQYALEGTLEPLRFTSL